MTRASATSAVFALVLGGLAAVSAARLVSESLGTSFGSFSATLDERAAWAFEHAAKRVEAELGVPVAAELELYPALRDHTPPEAFVFFFGDADSATTHNAYNHCEVLLYPRRFLSMTAMPESWDPNDPTLDENVHAVGYESFRELDLSRWCDLVAEGTRFRLWRFKPRSRREQDG